MLFSDFPPIVSIWLHIPLHMLITKSYLNDILEKNPSSFFKLEELLVNLDRVSLFPLFHNGIPDLDPAPVEHLVVVFKDSHHAFQHSTVHCQCLLVGNYNATHLYLIKL